jgi:hypothetical protein
MLVSNNKVEIGRGLAQACLIGSYDIIKIFLDDPKI